MLDTTTKRRIDTARDILVGKVPDPKSQVEQITIALIYKFMDDIDAESEEFGGTRKFFAGDFARYGWPRLVRSGLGGHETLNLYAEAITRMPENPGIPPLFRNIFNNAYLPYRDPETLRAFLKIIDEFEYDHSERLGDAFEYLLSVLGSQGDAGQFRTPRHIIDFIVDVIDPKKEDTILDPACGTAGFLISSYKHILRANMDMPDGQDNVNESPGSMLTPDEKGRLAANFKGYDISPDMVRLSLVNLYLHGFVEPHIFEYDTLTSEERWNEYADVILANPPFMSPKGGIRPHSRFSVKSKRSEVLFVDYMAEHLTPAGRAGIIVPEGIIFQSQNAHKQLRKMLVENYLVAVVSLPGGVFNPYSGVKTSILLLDKTLAKKSDRIAFFKVENDGFDLGAQRRPIAENDLPRVTQAVKGFLSAVRAGMNFAGNMDGPVCVRATRTGRQDVQDKEKASPSSLSMLRSLIEQGTALIAGKEKITANREYNLSGERYRTEHSIRSEWPSVKVKDVFKKAEETVLPMSLRGPVNYIGLQNITQTSGQLSGNVVTAKPAEIKSLKNAFCPGDILYGKLRPNLNKVWLSDRKGICSTDIFVVRTLDERVLPALYVYVFRSGHFNDAVLGQLKGAQLPRIGWQSFANLQIPLPPQEVQREIVAEIEGYQRVIDGARAVIDNYRPHIVVDPEWPMVKVGSLARIVRGSSPRPKGDPNYYGGPIPRLMVADITRDGMYTTPQIDSLTYEGAKKSRPMKKGDVIITVSGNPGLPTILAKDACIHDGFVGLRHLKSDLALAAYLYFNLLAQHEIHGSQSVGAVFKNLTTHQIRDFEIPLPPLETQQTIVAEIEAEQALVAANRELIERMEGKIQAAIGRVWGEDKTKGS